MRRIRAVGIALTLAGALVLGACTAGPGDSGVPDQKVLTRSTNEALALLSKSPVQGYQAQAVESGEDRADDEGHEVSETLKGRALFQIVCSGTGDITVTMPRQKVSKLVTCGKQATGFPFRGQLTALVVGARSSTGVYAWRILPAT
jgi:hypothetical protein